MDEILDKVSAVNVRVHYQAAKAAFKRAAIEDGLVFDETAFKVTGNNTRVQPYEPRPDDKDAFTIVTSLDICGMQYDYATYVVPDDGKQAS